MKTTFDSFVKRNCYSYTRFSSAAQAEGDSYRRQMEKTVEFCQRHDLHLNETRYADLGVSGWTGENIEKGALGDFIAALAAGKIPKGSVLIVENWDRFSRLKPMDAYTKLGDIIKAGVDVVTLEDGKFHTAENYNEFTTLITSLVIMERANEESTRKSRLVRAACEQKRKLVLAGKGIINGNCPPWLKVNAEKTGFEVRPERVAIVHRIIRQIKEGKGKREIARILDAEKVPTWGSDKKYKNKEWARVWRENYILEMVKSRALVGELKLQRRKRDEGEVVPNYYPAVIDEATWQSIQPKKIKTYNAGPQSSANNLFSGLLYDGYNPGYRMRFLMVNKENGYAYLKSDYATVDPLYLARKRAIAKGGPPGARPLSGKSIRYTDFEKHFLGYMGEINLAEALPENPAAESSRVALLENEKKENDRALANLVKALEKGDSSVVVMEQIHKREGTARRLAKELAAVLEQDRRAQYARDGIEAEGRRIMEFVVAEGRDARLSLRALFHRVIERIEIYPHGLPELPDTLKGIKINGFSVKEVIWRGRAGVMCYSVKLVGSSRRIWNWWDGTRLWEEGEGKPAKLCGFTSLKNKSKSDVNASFQEWMKEVERWKKPKPMQPDGGGNDQAAGGRDQKKVKRTPLTQAVLDKAAKTQN
jgi:DNA invertase Pin-like site-specific DNA recombinase